MNPTPDIPSIAHDPAAQRFEVRTPQGIAHADYRRVDDTLQLVHTEVPAALEGRGIAGALVRTALDYATSNGLKVLPLCSYVRGYMKRHPETHALLAPGARLV
ncbi:MAG: N-acetyltransferase [Burkholderiales bacterium]|nr:N-acetyltransferase [Burkholderiales bacterium]